MCILKWFKHEEVVNTETEGDRHARAMFHAKVEHKEPKIERDDNIIRIPYTNKFMYNDARGTMWYPLQTNVYTW
jgi:hypothetical protein